MEMNATVDRLKRLSRDQYGVFTVEQAAEVGIDEAALARLREAELLQRAAVGVYKVQGVEEDHGEGAFALWLTLDPTTSPSDRVPPRCGVLSHASAALWLDPLSFDGANLTVTVPPGINLTARAAVNAGWINIHEAELPATDWFLHHGVPVTTPARTVMDLLDEHGNHDETSVGRMLNGMHRAGVVDFQDLAARLDDYAKREEYGDGAKLVRLLSEAARPVGPPMPESA